jgi:hypothetical protein
MVLFPTSMDGHHGIYTIRSSVMLTITTTTSESTTPGIHRTMIQTRWVFGYFFNFKYKIRKDSGRKAHAMRQCHDKFLHRGQVAGFDLIRAAHWQPSGPVCERRGHQSSFFFFFFFFFRIVDPDRTLAEVLIHEASPD